MQLCNFKILQRLLHCILHRSEIRKYKSYKGILYLLLILEISLLLLDVY